MKRVIILCVALLAFSLSAFAQDSHTGFWQLQGGYNNSNNAFDSGFMLSTGVGFKMSEHFDLGFNLGYWQGKQGGGFGDVNIMTFFVAPQYVNKFGNDNEFYALIGLGLAEHGSSTYDFGFYRYRLASETVWAGEAAAGIRHFFNDKVGLSFQLTYTHMDFNQTADVADGRIGVVVRW
ncbi:MAG: outer membrane beta-barrel protein [Acidobacteriota bacterium]